MVVLVFLFLIEIGFSSVPEPPEEDEQVRNLRVLLQNHSGWSLLTSRSSRFGGRGLFCSTDVSANQTVMLIPSTLVFGPETANRLYPNVWNSLVGAEELVASALARERFSKKRLRRTLWQLIRGFEEPDFSSWIAVMPQQAVRNAALWTKDDALLAHSVFERLPNVRPGRASWGEWTGVTRSQFRWALSMVLSRSFAGAYMVPFVDLANHAEDDEVPLLRALGVSFEDAVRWGDSIRWSLSKDCKTGQEVFLNYGSRDALLMEGAFGFVGSSHAIAWNNKTSSCSDLKKLLKQRGSPIFPQTWEKARVEISKYCK